MDAKKLPDDAAFRENLPDLPPSEVDPLQSGKVKGGGGWKYGDSYGDTVRNVSRIGSDLDGGIS